MTNELISIIIPVKNGANYLEEAIASIKKQNMNTEIIVVDDGSTDNTSQIAKNCGAEVYSIPSGGASAARNFGLKKYTGKYVMFLDHDDIIIENGLQTLYNEFEKDKNLQAVMGKLKDFVSPELTDEERQTLSPRSDAYGGALFGTMLFKREVFDDIGGFNEQLKTGEGIEFLLRAEKNKTKYLKIDFVSVMRRLHNNNMGRTMQKQEFTDYASILRAKLGKK